MGSLWGPCIPSPDAKGTDRPTLLGLGQGVGGQWLGGLEGCARPGPACGPASGGREVTALCPRSALVSTNEHLLQELGRARALHRAEAQQLHWSYEALKRAMGLTPHSSALRPCTPQAPHAAACARAAEGCQYPRCSGPTAPSSGTA